MGTVKTRGTATLPPAYSTHTMSDIAIGVPIYTRTHALTRLLESIPGYVDTVYVADNGPPDQRDRDPYTRDWPFTLTVLELEHDAGIGACRHAITQACREPYLWVGDSDMEFARPNDLCTLRRVLDTHPDLGGVSGWLLEDRAVRAGARNLHKHNDIAIKEADDTRPRDGGTDCVPFIRFDFIPQAGLFRTEIYDDYTYDPDMESSEHFDFFWAHKQLDEWDFASTPHVTIIHNRTINESYRETERGNSHVDLDILEEKWGVHDIQPGGRPDWAAVSTQSLAADVFDLVKQTTPPRVWIPLKNAAQRVGVK